MELSELPNDPKITVRFQAPHASDPSALLAFRPFNPCRRIFRHGVVTAESAGRHESKTPLRRPKADCPLPGPGPRGNEAIGKWQAAGPPMKLNSSCAQGGRLKMARSIMGHAPH